MRAIHLLTATAIATIVTQANGQNVWKADCANVQVSQDVDRCAAQRYSDADKRLNETYKRVMASIDSGYKPEPRLGEELKAEVKKAQLAWLDYRDAQCAVEAFEIEKGKPAYLTAVKGCETRLTNERIEVLNTLLEH